MRSRKFVELREGRFTQDYPTLNREVGIKASLRTYLWLGAFYEYKCQVSTYQAHSFPSYHTGNKLITMKIANNMDQGLMIINEMESVYGNRIDGWPRKPWFRSGIVYSIKERARRRHIMIRPWRPPLDIVKKCKNGYWKMLEW